MVSEGRVDRQVREIVSDGLSHVTDHLDHHVCRQLSCWDVRGAVPGGDRHDCYYTLIKLNTCLLHIQLNAAYSAIECLCGEEELDWNDIRHVVT